jgi:hypothetical protein
VNAQAEDALRSVAVEWDKATSRGCAHRKACDSEACLASPDTPRRLLLTSDYLATGQGVSTNVPAFAGTPTFGHVAIG